MKNECLSMLVDLFTEKALKPQTKKLESETGEKISNKIELVFDKKIIMSNTEMDFENDKFIKCITRVMFEKAFNANKYIFKSESRLKGLKTAPNYSGFKLSGRIELTDPVPFLITVSEINKYNVNEWSSKFIV